MNRESNGCNLTDVTLRLVQFVVASCLLISSAEAASIFWTDPAGPSGSHLIRSANADGTGMQTGNRSRPV